MRALAIGLLAGFFVLGIQAGVFAEDKENPEECPLQKRRCPAVPRYRPLASAYRQ